MSKSCKHCKEIKPLDMFYKHPQMADGHINVCKVCRDKYLLEWAADNREKKRKIARESAAKNYDTEKRATAFKKWYDGTAQANGMYDRMVGRASKRGRLVKQAHPIWANDFFIEEAYDLARLRTNATGVEWQVDHIVPVESKLVCGLHAHTNIQVITAFLNRSKRNRYWPDMPNS